MSNKQEQKLKQFENYYFFFEGIKKKRRDKFNASKEKQENHKFLVTERQKQLNNIQEGTLDRIRNMFENNKQAQKEKERKDI